MKKTTIKPTFTFIWMLKKRNCIYKHCKAKDIALIHIETKLCRECYEYNNPIKRIRIARNLMQNDMAVILEVVQSTIAKMENQDRDPSTAVLRLLNTKFNINLNKFVKEKSMNTAQHVAHKNRIKAFKMIEDKSVLMLGSGLDDQLKTSLYLDYFNNFLTVAHFAEYYGLTSGQASELIEEMKEKLAVKGEL